MKVRVIWRDWKHTFKDILKEYMETIKEFDGEYEERELSFDDNYALFISDSAEIYKMGRDELYSMAYNEDEEL